MVDALPDFAQQFVKGVRPAFVAQRIQAYLASVSFADAMLGRVLDAMDRGNHWDDTTLVRFSDHGYQLGDHDTWVKFSLWEEAANAPLIIVDPDQDGAGRRVTTPVGLTQLLPTLADLVGFRAPSTVTTASFAGLIDAGQGAYPGRPVLTYIYGSISMRDGDHRLIRYEDGSVELYDIASDPAQVDNLALDPANAALLAGLFATLRNAGRAEGIRFSDTLGVLNGGALDDVLIARDTVATAAGGAGDDIHFVSAGTQIMERLGEGEDTVVLRSLPGSPPSVFRMAAEVENMRAGMVGAPVLVLGNSLDNRFSLVGGFVSVNAGAGNDRLAGFRAAETLDGGAGDDQIDGGDGGDVLSGGNGSDRIDAGKGADVVDAGPGRDLVSLGAGADRLVVRNEPGRAPDSLRVTVFDARADVLELVGFRFASPGEARRAFVVGPNGATPVANGETIVLEGVSAAELGLASIALTAASPPAARAERPAPDLADEPRPEAQPAGGALPDI